MKQRKKIRTSYSPNNSPEFSVLQSVSQTHYISQKRTKKLTAIYMYQQNQISISHPIMNIMTPANNFAPFWSNFIIYLFFDYTSIQYFPLNHVYSLILQYFTPYCIHFSFDYFPNPSQSISNLTTWKYHHCPTLIELHQYKIYSWLSITTCTRERNTSSSTWWPKK